MTTQLTLERRHPYRYADRPTFWYDPGTGQTILPDGSSGVVLPGTSLTMLLEDIESYTITKYGKKSAVLYLVAGLNLEDHPAWEWFQVSGGWRLDKLIKRSVNAEYNHNNFNVSLYSTGNYFGSEKDLDKLTLAWVSLEQHLEHKFHAEGYKLLASTPAGTGQELISISLPKDRSYPRLDDELLDLIIHNFGQARVETFPPRRAVLKNGVYILDGRWMYASCLSHLPTGPVQHDAVDKFIGDYTKTGRFAAHAPGFYYVTARVPDGWHHIGLLKSPGGEVIDASGHYPNIPGETFTNWTTADELALAIDKGWHITIHERIIWPYPDTDPLATWRKNLVELRLGVNDPLLEAAIRSIVLHTIGSFHQYMNFEERHTPRGQMLPALFPEGSFYKLLASTASEHIWLEAIPLEGKNRQLFIHPEWSATVWGRARRRLAEFALRLPYEDIVCLMTDCVWSASLPDWLAAEDTGKPGVFREKDCIPEAWQWPRSMAEMRSEAINRNRSNREKFDEEVLK